MKNFAQVLLEIISNLNPIGSFTPWQHFKLNEINQIILNFTNDVN
jgi:hypothetical protein